MKKINRLYVVVLTSIVFLSCKAVAQTPDNGKLTKIQLEVHKKDYAKKAKDVGLIIKPEFFYKYKIDINKVKEFKAAGLDLIEMGQKVGVRNYKENSLASDIVLQGVIVEKNYNQDEEVYFHTTYKIEVKNKVKGDISSDYIYVKTVSGSIGEDRFVNRSTEPKLYLGENVLLMLNKVDVEGIEQARKEGYFEKKLNATSSDYTINGKYSLKANSFFNEHKEFMGNKNKVYSTIKNILTINDSNSFYFKKFK